ncbi:unnamed protein product [Haemonchus placei]|uniref:Endo/exonuclease/phosphatase domain-containing protein n=1 Tax=Haemonchus placei TaxID=6290 RepID=A0A0N4W6S6_HAEPC|nr:unnamed protein product [Haemonchus placei]
MVSVQHQAQVDRPADEDTQSRQPCQKSRTSDKARTSVADLMKRRKIQVLCLQETSWKGAKAGVAEDCVKPYYNGKNNG